MRFIDDFFADILAADRHWRTPPPPPAGPHAYGQLRGLLTAWLDAHVTAGQPLPGWRGQPSITAIAAALGRNRISVARYRHLIDQAAAIVGTTPQLATGQPVRGRLDGQPWSGPILADHTEPDSLAALACLLQDACYIVLAFLSGARDSEIKHLRRGGLTIERDASGTPYRWKMHSLAFKAENDPAGIPATWSIGEPAARAIIILEQLQPPRHRLPVRPAAAQPRQQAGRGQPGADQRRHQRPPERIRRLGQQLLRAARASRWHPRSRRPHLAPEKQPVQAHIGLVHRPPPRRRHRRRAGLPAPLRPGLRRLHGTSESGFRAEVESEEALARGEHLMAAIDAHQHTSLTGPAAEEAARRLEAFAERARFQGTVITDQARLRRLMARHDPAIYPGKYITCVHDHTKALCEKARHGRGEGLPDHGGCKPLACRNVALTPANTAAWQCEIDRIDARLATRPPLPPLLRHRLQARRAEIATFLTRNTASQESA